MGYSFTRKKKKISTTVSGVPPLSVSSCLEDMNVHIVHVLGGGGSKVFSALEFEEP